MSMYYSGIIYIILNFLCIKYVSSDVVPFFPLQLSANVEITAHLIEESSEYPPKRRRMTVYYDYIRKLGRVDIEEGYEAAKTYIRRYDLKNEYMIRLPPISDCRRSYLGDIMPFPDIPNTEFKGYEQVSGKLCKYFLHTDGDSRVHIYMSTDNNSPVRLIQESVENGISTPLLTYDYSNVALGPVDTTLFDVPKPYSHDMCERQVGGFPYVHIFHYFVKF